jgi:hypothetical protein
MLTFDIEAMAVKAAACLPANSRLPRLCCWLSQAGPGQLKKGHKCTGLDLEHTSVTVHLECPPV